MSTESVTWTRPKSGRTSDVEHAADRAAEDVRPGRRDDPQAAQHGQQSERPRAAQRGARRPLQGQRGQQRQHGGSRSGPMQSLLAPRAASSVHATADGAARDEQRRRDAHGAAAYQAIQPTRSAQPSPKRCSGSVALLNSVEVVAHAGACRRAGDVPSVVRRRTCPLTVGPTRGRSHEQAVIVATAASRTLAMLGSNVSPSARRSACCA